ncbi:MAG TPA: DUF4352 domain-containing protein [Peptostreptococcaceae bacterium]|nr:DUF4352 domain-containing protein [Peptostreptococcaceae bacterium]
MRQLLKWGIISIIALGIISTLDSKELSTIQTVNTNTEKEEVAKVYKIGDKIQADKLTYKVEGAEVKDTVGEKYINKRAKGKYLILKVSITNDDKKARVVDNSFFQLVDKDGIIYEPDGEADLYVNNNDMFFFDEINPKITKIGYIAFDLFDANADYDLNITDGMLSETKAIINLN